MKGVGCSVQAKDLPYTLDPTPYPSSNSENLAALQLLVAVSSVGRMVDVVA